MTWGASGAAARQRQKSVTGGPRDARRSASMISFSHRRHATSIVQMHKSASIREASLVASALVSAGMEQRPHTRLNAAAAAFATNAVNSNLRRAQLSYFAAWTAWWADRRAKWSPGMKRPVRGRLMAAGAAFCQQCRRTQRLPGGGCNVRRRLWRPQSSSYKR